MNRFYKHSTNVVSSTVFNKKGNIFNNDENYSNNF